jgi:uncharacterized SAM-binding protein YcdF (DUF218 family)
MIDIIARLMVPSGAILVLIFAAIILCWRRRTRKLSLWLTLGALGIYLVFGSGVVAHSLLGPLERCYDPVTDPELLGDVDVIVMLTGYASTVEKVSPPSWVNFSSAYRVMEVQWLKQRFPESRILISGTKGSARTLEQVMTSLGMDADGIFIDAGSRDTAASAGNVARHIASGERCVLVTSAGHMPRSMMSFAHKGRNCTPVPTEFYTPFKLAPLSFLPSPEKLRLSDLAVHEYAGIAWYWLRGYRLPETVSGHGDRESDGG